jgi:hypothetical protein
MKWLFNKVIGPVFKAMTGVLVKVFQWAYKTPTAGIVLGTTALIGSLFMPKGDVNRALVQMWGVGMLAAGILGWITPGLLGATTGGALKAVKSGLFVVNPVYSL